MCRPLPSIASVVVLLASLGRAQEPTSFVQGLAPPPLFRSAVELVVLNVTVLDERKRFVGGLGPKDFVVYENGVRQEELAFFGLSDVPVDLVLMLDQSASMGAQMEIARKAAVGLVRTLRADDRAMLVGFGGRTNVLQPLTGDIDRLKQAVQQPQPGGPTALYDAVYIVLGELRRDRLALTSIRRQVAVVLTDGVDTASLMSGDDVLSAARRSGVVMYTVALTPPGPLGDPRRFDRSTAEAAFTLKSLAQDSGGLAFLPKKPEELEGIYAKIAAEIAHQYLLAYVPGNGPSDRTFRTVNVRVTSQVRAEVRTRRGYYMSDRSLHPAASDLQPLMRR
jgi:VWFA-related protein